MTEPSELLRVDALDAGYFGVPVVRELSLSVAAGEVVALLGPNGAGKTTTLSCIAGLIAPLNGRITLLGSEIGGRPAHRVARAGVAFVPEGRALFPALTVAEHLRLAQRSGDQSSTEELLALFPELRRCLRRQVGVLSGGEQQMLAVGRALVGQPKLLLVDEMSLGLAPTIVSRMMPVLRQIANDRSVGVLFVEQHVPLALRIADRAYVLNRGELVLDRPAAELRANPELLKSSYLGGVPTAPLQPVRP
jgi:branched-chain amino acid transport system ATP-binding protein